MISMETEADIERAWQILHEAERESAAKLIMLLREMDGAIFVLKREFAHRLDDQKSEVRQLARLCLADREVLEKLSLGHAVVADRWRELLQATQL